MTPTSKQFSLTAKILKAAASFLNEYYNFHFTRENSSPMSDDLDVYDNVPDLFTLEKNHRYTSPCPYSKSKVPCLRLSYTASSAEINSFKTSKEYQNGSKFLIFCSVQDDPDSDCCECCRSKNRFDGIYAELYSALYYYVLEESSNDKKEIKTLLGKEHFFHVYKKTGLSIMEAATGSGKTFYAVLTAIVIVLSRPTIAILAFPTLKLLIQTSELLKRLLKTEIPANKIELPEDREYPPVFTVSDIEIYIITQSNNTKYSQLNNLFLEGLGKIPNKNRRPRIFLTVHSYFKLRGDAPEVSPLAALILKYKNSIWLAIDEVHNFINSCTFQVPFESMQIVKNESTFEGMSTLTPWSIKDINVRSLRSIEIIRGFLSRVQEEQGGLIWKLKGPGSSKQNAIRFNLEFQENSEIALNTTTSTKRILKIIKPDKRQDQKEEADISEAVEFDLDKGTNDSNSGNNPHAYLAAFEKKIAAWLFELEVNPTAKMQLPNTKTWLSFLLNTSYRPSVVFYKPYSRALGRKITLQEFKEYHEQRYKSNIKNIYSESEEQEQLKHKASSVINPDQNQNQEEKFEIKKRDIIFPKGNLPFTSVITAMNMFPMYVATQCNTCIFVSATIEEYHAKFIKICLVEPKREVNHFCVKLKDDKKLDELVFVLTRANWFNVFKSSFWLYTLHIFEQLADFYTIGFCENQNQAKKFFQWFSNYTSALGLILEGSEIQGANVDISYCPTTGERKEGRNAEKNIVVASSLGVMGTGLNLPEQKLIFFTLGLFKPISVFWHCDTTEEAKVILIQDLISSIQQTLGRNRRMTASERSGEKKAKRVTYLMGIQNFRGLLPYLVSKAKESFNEVHVVDMMSLENDATNVAKQKGVITNDGVEISEKAAITLPDGITFQTSQTDDSSPDISTLNQLDFLRLRSVHLMALWLLDKYNGQFDQETINKILNSEELNNVQERKIYQMERTREWLSRQPQSGRNWRGLMRKLNINRETREIQLACEDILNEFIKLDKDTETNPTNDFANRKDTETTNPMNDANINKDTETTNLMNEVANINKEMETTNSMNEVVNINKEMEITNPIDFSTEKEDNVKNAINEVVKLACNSKEKVNLIADTLVNQYCAVFPYNLSVDFKNVIEKRFKHILKLVSKNGLKVLESGKRKDPADGVRINLITQLIFNYLCIEINAFLKTKQKCLIHPPINLHGSYHNTALLYIQKEKRLKKAFIDIEQKNIWESLEPDFTRHKQVNLYNQHPLFTKLAVYYFLFGVSRSDDKIIDQRILREFTAQIGIEESHYSQKHFKALDDYERLKKVSKNITTVLRQSKLIAKFQALSASLLNDRIYCEDFTKYHLEIFQTNSVYPPSILESIEFCNENKVFLSLHEEFPNLEVLGNFAYGYKKLNVFVISELQEKNFIEKIIRTGTEQIGFINEAQIERAQTNDNYSNTLGNIL